jgi:quercetin dioxygenase-like cupin family protein
VKKLILSFVVIATAAGAAGAAAVKAAERHVVQDEVKWGQPFGPQGPAFGFVVGQMGDKKPASFFVKAAAGFDSGWHIHDEDYEAIVVKGTFTEQQQGDAAETVLPAGSYFSQVAKKNHRNGCSKDGDCLVYVHFDKGASNHPMTPEGKPAPVPPAAPAPAK